MNVLFDAMCELSKVVTQSEAHLRYRELQSQPVSVNRVVWPIFSFLFLVEAEEFKDEDPRFHCASVSQSGAEGVVGSFHLQRAEIIGAHNSELAPFIYFPSSIFFACGAHRVIESSLCSVFKEPPPAFCFCLSIQVQLVF